MNRVRGGFSGAVGLSFLAMAMAAGCSTFEPGSQRVVALNNQDVVALDANDMVRIMRRAGLSDQQVLDLGTDLRNALASAGAAHVVCEKKVEVIFVVDGDVVRATTRHRGTFIYDVKRRAFR